jgi:hypothetical protein
MATAWIPVRMGSPTCRPPRTGRRWMATPRSVFRSCPRRPCAPHWESWSERSERAFDPVVPCADAGSAMCCHHEAGSSRTSTSARERAAHASSDDAIQRCSRLRSHAAVDPTLKHLHSFGRPRSVARHRTVLHAFENVGSMGAHVVEGPKIKSSFHGLAVKLSEERLDVRRKAHAVVVRRRVHVDNVDLSVLPASSGSRSPGPEAGAASSARDLGQGGGRNRSVPATLHEHMPQNVPVRTLCARSQTSRADEAPCIRRPPLVDPQSTVLARGNAGVLSFQHSRVTLSMATGPARSALRDPFARPQRRTRPAALPRGTCTRRR